MELGEIELWNAQAEDVLGRWYNGEMSDQEFEECVSDLGEQIAGRHAIGEETLYGVFIQSASRDLQRQRQRRLIELLAQAIVDVRCYVRKASETLAPELRVYPPSLYFR
jgi:hypothetical protein